MTNALTPAPLPEGEGFGYAGRSSGRGLSPPARQEDAGTAGGTWQYLYDAADERLVRVPLASGAQASTRRGIARFIVQAKVQAGAWTLPTTTCAEASRRFTDVHCADPDWAYIEVFAAQGITSGCGSGNYCPETAVARDQMAVFLLKTKNGGTYTPPACTPPGSFTDVPCPSYPFANAIYAALAQGLTSGCGGSNYCPTQAVSETAMATFLNKPALALQSYRGIQGGSFYTVRDEANRLVTEFADGFPTRDNVFLGNLVVASYVSKTPSNPNPSWQFHGSDHPGTVRVSVNGSNGANEKHKYWPYGDEVTTPSPPPLTQRLAFAAMERDTETTHFYDHARTQDFGLGRFGSPDQVGGRSHDPQTWNRYSYARTNPLKYVDPDGREDQSFYDLERRGGAWGNVDDSGHLVRLGAGPSSPADAMIMGPFFAAHAAALLPLVSQVFVQSPATASLTTGLAANSIRVEQSVERGLVNAGGKLEAVLRGLQTSFSANAPQSADQALLLVGKVTQGLGLDAGTLSKGANGALVLKNVGGVTTTMLSTGEVIVARGADIVLRLIPR